MSGAYKRECPRCHEMRWAASFRLGEICKHCKSAILMNTVRDADSYPLSMRIAATAKAREEGLLPWESMEARDRYFAEHYRRQETRGRWKPNNQGAMA